MISNKKKAAIDAIDEFKRDVLNHFIIIAHGNDYEKISLLQIGNVVDALYEKHVRNILKSNTAEKEIAEIAVLGCTKNPQAYKVEECIKCAFKDGMCDSYKHAKKIYQKYFTDQLNNEMERAKNYDL